MPDSDPVTAAVAAAATGLPDAEVTVTGSGTVIVRFPGDVAFYVTSSSR